MPSGFFSSQYSTTFIGGEIFLGPFLGKRESMKVFEIDVSTKEHSVNQQRMYFVGIV